jgi:cytochrome c biogenesis protein ResB
VTALVALLAFSVSGCETTQDKASAKQAESKRILEKREQKRKRKHQAKSGEKGGEKR